VGSDIIIDLLKNSLTETPINLYWGYRHLHIKNFNAFGGFMGKTFWLAVSFILASVLAAVASPGDTLWTRTYGGPEREEARVVQQTSDGGFIMAGPTRSYGAGNWDFSLAKTDSAGTYQWVHVYGGNNLDWPYSAQQTNDGGYIIAGYTASFGAGWTDFYIVKTDAQGIAQWTRTYGGALHDEAHSISQTSDGGYIVAGSTASFGSGGWDFYIVKLNSSGDSLWSRTFGGNGDDVAWSVKEGGIYGGYYIAGYSTSFGNGNEIFVVRTNSSGYATWTRTYGGAQDDYAYSIDYGSDGGFVLAGFTSSYGAGSNDFYLVKIDASGDSQWTQTYGGAGDDRGYSVKATNDGGYAFAGVTDSFGAGMLDFYLVKTGASGNSQWTHTYGGSDNDWGHSVEQTTDQGFVIAGFTESFGVLEADFYLVKVEGAPVPPCTDVNMVPDTYPIMVPPGGSFGLVGIIGNPNPDPVITDIWVGVHYNNAFYELDAFSNILVNPGQYIATHLNQSVPGYAPLGTYKYSAYCGDHSGSACDSASFQFTVAGSRTDSGTDEWTLNGGWGNDPNYESFGVPTETALEDNYPNPFNAQTTISYQLAQDCMAKLEIYNLLGQRVATLLDGQISGGDHTVSWDASLFSSGIYFSKLTVNEKVFTKRMTLLK